MNKEDLAVGQQVKVHEHGHEYGRTYDGEVVKIGRTLVTIKYNRHEEKFRIDTQHVNDAWGSSFFRTLEQEEEIERRNTAVKTLREYGLEIRLGWHNKIATEYLVKVANVLKESDV